MLHITSLMQNVAKRNKNRHQPNSLTHLNSLTRNFSFVFDNYSNKCDVNYEPDSDDENETSAKGYWGYLRDQKADKQLRIRSSLNVTSPVGSNSASEQIQPYRNEPDRYCWGLFKDVHLESTFNKKPETKKPNKPRSPRTPIFVKNSSSEDSILSSDSDKYSPSQLSPTEKPPSPKMPKKIVYDYKRSKFKIEAQKRDEMKIFIQNLEDQEATFRKNTIKSFDPVTPVASNEPIATNTGGLSNSLFTQDLISIVKNHRNLLSTAKSSPGSSKIISFLLYSNKSDAETFNYNSFRRVFTAVSKLNKSINILIGKSDSNNNDITSAFFHTTVNDLNDLIEKSHAVKASSPTTTASKNNSVSLCSNVFEKLVSTKSSLTANLKPYGLHNHSTMLIEHQGVKIGFMALFDQEFFNKLVASVPEQVAGKLEYLDYVQEADRLSKQLRLNGANLIVAIVNMTTDGESRLAGEASDLDIILSPSADPVKFSMLKENKWLVKGSSQPNIISLFKLKLTQTQQLSQKYVLSDLAINEYYLE